MLLPLIRADSKPLPEFLPFAREHWPEFDWELKASMPYHQFNDMRILCLEHLDRGRARPNSCHIADLVATMLQATCVVLDQERFFFECFDGGFWTVPHKDALESRIHGSLMALTKSVFGETRVPPEPVNDVHFCASLIPAVLGRLSGCAAAPLDGEHSLMKLLCADGMIVDFSTKERRKARPCDRMCLRAAASSEAWCPLRLTQLFEQIKVGRNRAAQFRGGQACGGVLPAGGAGRARALGRAQALRRVGPRPLRPEDVHPRSGGRQQVLRDVLRLRTGAQRQGRPVSHPHGVQRHAAWHLLDRQRGRPEQASPFLSRLEGKRLVWASEVPPHDDLNVDFIKPFCEQAGAPICSRALHRSPKDFRPSALLVCTSNSPPVVKDKSDDGFTRRARVWQTRGKFVKQPKELTDHKADDSLKPKITAGHFNKFLLYLVENLVDALDSAYNTGTQLLPRPSDTRELEQEMASSDGGGVTVESFLATRCAKVDLQINASKYSTFIKALVLFLGVSELNARMAATRAGITSKSAGKFKAAVSKEGAWKLNADADAD